MGLCLPLAVRGIRRAVLLQLASLAAAGAQPYSLDQMVELALKNNRELQAAKHRVPEAKGALLQAGLRPNPTLEMSLGNGAIVRNSGYWDGSIGYSQMIELGGKRARRVEVAEAGSRAVGFEIQDRERNLRAAIHAAFIDWLAAQRNLDSSRQLLALTTQSLKVVQARVQQGEAPRLDQSLLDVELSRIETEIQVFQSQANRALDTIRALAGLAPEDPVTLAGALDLPPVAPELEHLTQVRTQALSDRPDIRFLREAERSSAAEIRLERANAIPNLTASIRYGYTYDFIQRVQINPAFSVPITDRCPIITAGVSIDLPWRNRNQGNIEAASARLNNTRSRREHQELTAANEIAGATRRLAATRAAAIHFEKSVLARAGENLRVVRGVYEHGELRLLDVLNEQRRLMDSQRTYTDLLKESQLAWVELQRATGVAGGELRK